MVRRLRTSPQARNCIQAITRHIARSHGESSALEYRDALNKSIELIKVQPRLWPLVEDGQGKYLHRAIVRKLTILLYTYTDDEILLEAVFDARSDWKQV